MNNTNKREEMNQDASPIPFPRILEAVAKGVELRLVLTVVAEMVTFETIFLARKLEIPEEEIQEWCSSRYHEKELTGDRPFFKNIGEIGKKYFELFSITDKKKDFL
jgi:hypothetical protein